ncbi:MAG TPA: hypothetical protein VE597_01260 [Geminicoccaceae bacterium]|nr:hypothetical protein [Geminicoccaceae bacterium]
MAGHALGRPVGFLLTQIDAAFAGRAYAAYGGVYIGASLFWLWIIEGARPDRWDLTGTAVCLVGAAIILLGPPRLNAQAAFEAQGAV